MDEKDRQSAFMSALTTEHFVLQTAANATTHEVGTRAALYIYALSSSLVAIGFVSRSPEVFIPFLAIVLPAVFLLGVITSVRLVDSNLEGMQFLMGIARIRRYYRTLGPEAGDYFAAERGRWPESREEPSLRLGLLLAFLTTTASMVAFINSIVAGVGAALLVRALTPIERMGSAAIGGITALALMGAFLVYQRWRYRPFDSVET
jgi:hypothetical protein